MSLVFKLGHNGTTWIDKATGKTVYKVDVGSGSEVITTWGGVSGVAAKYRGGGYLYMADSLDFSFGGGDWTINTWWRYGGNSSLNGIVSYGIGTTEIFELYFNNYKEFYINIHQAYTEGGNGHVRYYYGKFNIPEAIQTILAGRAWTHVEVSRSSGAFLLFINGVNIPVFSESYIDTGSGELLPGFAIWEITSSFYIGLHGSVPYYSAATFENLSIYKGECCHTVGFNPSYPGLLPGFQVL